MKSLKIIRLAECLNRCGYSRSTHYTNVKKGTSPQPVKLGARSSGYVEDEVAAVIAARIAGKSDDEIRELVTNLVAQRQELIKGWL